MTEQELLSALEAIIYAADEPATLDQIVAAIIGEKANVRTVEHNEAAAENSAEPHSLNADANVVVEADVFNRPAYAEHASNSQQTNVEVVSSSDTQPNAHHDSRAQIRVEIRSALDKLAASYAADERGIEVRKVAGGWKMYTKAQHHELVRRFIKVLRPPLRLTMPALETLSVIAYKQPATLPEINEVRGVNCGGVVKTLLERRLITTAGRKEAVGRPILYRTSKDFLMRFGLADLDELPSLKEFEQLAQAALGADEGIAPTEPEEEGNAAPTIGRPELVTREPRASGARGNDVQTVEDVSVGEGSGENSAASPANSAAALSSAESSQPDPATAESSPQTGANSESPTTESKAASSSG